MKLEVTRLLTMAGDYTLEKRAKIDLPSADADTVCKFIILMSRALADAAEPRNPQPE
jgi:hypothetical protein